MNPFRWILPRPNEASSSHAGFASACEISLLRDAGGDANAEPNKNGSKNDDGLLPTCYGTNREADVGSSTAVNRGDDDSSSEDYVPIEYDAPRPALGSACASMWSRYVAAIDKNPLLVKSVTAFFILLSGDLCGQGLERVLGSASRAVASETGVDWPRAARFGMFGLLGAPWAHYFYYYLDRYLPPTNKPFTRTTLVKVCIDQGIQAPILLALMISTISLLKGTGLGGVREDLARNYWTSLLANWKLWLPFSFINLAFVKPTLRVLFVNVVFFGWTIILSMLINSSYD